MPRLVLTSALLLLASCSMARVEEAVAEGRREQATRYLRDVQAMVELHHVTHRALPDSIEAFDARDPTTGEVLARRVQPDPWGRDYRYRRTSATSYALWSAGPDGLDDTEDDVRLERGLR